MRCKLFTEGWEDINDHRCRSMSYNENVGTMNKIVMENRRIREVAEDVKAIR